MKSRLFYFLPLFLTIVSAKSEEVPFRFAGIFSDNAVLQRDAPVPVWGFANPGETISIQFGDQQKSTTVGEDGSWRVNLDSLSANAKPRNLTAKNSDETIVLRDLLVGEVWLCSGQSNMAMRVDRAKDPAKEKKASSLPGLRVFTVNRKAAPEPMSDVTGSWVVSSPETAGHFSATAFFFGREIHREVDVPVGLIVSAWSGSAIEAWTSREVQEQTPE
ncbi:MAG: sialate O-acetylesterase, partial [Verrucomicrobiales bacterium]|nr:sialate O-acetylesterase [Verrucomicrobiales bacterium]